MYQCISNPWIPRPRHRIGGKNLPIIQYGFDVRQGWRYPILLLFYVSWLLAIASYHGDSVKQWLHPFFTSVKPTWIVSWNRDISRLCLLNHNFGTYIHIHEIHDSHFIKSDCLAHRTCKNHFNSSTWGYFTLKSLGLLSHCFDDTSFRQFWFLCTAKYNGFQSC